MNPINIDTINHLNLKTKYSILSKYAQRFMKLQIKSISFNLERFISNINSGLILPDRQRLEEAGIKKIGKNLNEGIIIAGEKSNYHVFMPDNSSLNFNILKQDSNQIYQQFCLFNNTDEYQHAGNFINSNIEDTIIEILDFVDSKLIQAKRDCCSSEIYERPVLPNIIGKNFAERHKTSLDTQKNTDIKNAGFVSSKEKELIATIINKLQTTQELYKNISDGHTKYKLRSSYPNYLPQPVTNKLGFKNIGPNNESISFFYTTYKNNAHAAIIITDTDGVEIKYVISPEDGSVRKNLISKFVKSGNSEYRIFLTPDYYSQEDIDKSNLSTYLSCLDKEIDLFIEYTQNWFKKKNEIKLIKSNFNTATLDQYKELLDNIHSNFKEYRAKMRKYLRKTQKSKIFKTENNISTKLASTAVKFDNITSDGCDLRLSYPKVRDKFATQLLVMRGDKIENSFYIINNKLLRFDIKDLNDKITRYNRNLYYYDKQYLQNSNLYNYLLLLRDKLLELNEKLDAIREKQKENRIKYHNNGHKK